MSAPIKSARSLSTAVVVFVVTLALAAGVIYQAGQGLQQIARNRAQALAADHALALQLHLQQALSATNALAALVRHGGGEVANFEALASDMLALYPGVSALALEPNGVVERIVPLQGNARAIGLDLLKHPARQQAARLARDSGQLTLAGPFELVQGGLGALGFFPVFLTNAQGQRYFWGFTNAVIRLPQALGPAQLEQIGKQGYDYVLWRTDPVTQQRQVIAQSDASADVVWRDSVAHVLAVPNAQWTLSVAPRQGWGEPAADRNLKLALALLLSFLLAYVARQASLTQARALALEGAVSARTSEIGRLNRQLQATLDALPDLLFEMDIHGRYLACHSPRAELLAAPPDQLIGKTLHQVLPADAADTCLAALQEAQQQGFSHGRQFTLSLPDGAHWFELSASRKAAPVAVPDQTPTFMLLSRDITQRKAAELNVARLTKLYAALSQCNQAIVRCQGEDELFPIICRDAVNFGGMKMAWIGLLDEASQGITPVASFGQGTAYLDELHISLDPQTAKGHGPTAVAMREDRAFWCQDFQHDPATQVWHARGQQFGWGASAALPLHRGGRVIGAMNVYAAEVGAFDEAAQKLLLEMVLDISFALEHFAEEREHKRMVAALQDSEQRYRTAFKTSPDAININRLVDGLYLDVNQGFEHITGWQYAEVVGKASSEIGIWRDLADRQRLIDALQRDGCCSNLEADFVRKDGSLVRALMSAQVVQFKDEDCILSISRDISEMRRAEAQIQRLAHFDQLTGLPNRSLLQERFNFALTLAQRSGEQMALMFLDMDHFKNINDTLGHSVGDRVLVEMATRMSAVLRGQDTLSRQGGDEFILLLPAIDQEGASQVAAKLIAAVSQPLHIDHFDLVSTLSIGIAMYPHDGNDFESLSKNADAAMYRVKHGGRHNFCFFTQEMQARSSRALQLVNAMYQALERTEFTLHYQPQVNLQDGRIVGAEALLRWQHPELGALSPAEFIPIAEESGQIIEIGEWVLCTAVAQLKHWLDAGLPSLVVAVNLSAVQFRHPNLLALVTGVLAQAQLPPRYLELELTEATAMDSPATAIELMNQLHARGIRMSIDDFGTGYSSLSYLKKFKIYKLKIDQSFVRDISDNPDDKAIVTAIINLASSLGLHTIAEGVETASQLAFLRLQGCEEVQGCYFSKPLPAEAFEALLRAQPKR